jgi:hypothetical protein
VTIDGVRVGNRIYCTFIQLVTTLLQVIITHRLVFLVTVLTVAFNGGRSSASVLTSLQAGDHLTPTSYSDHWLQLVLPQLFAPRLNWTHIKSKSRYNRRSVGQSVLLSSAMWGALSDERTGLSLLSSQSQSQSQSYVTTDGSVGQSVLE